LHSFFTAGAYTRLVGVAYIVLVCYKDFHSFTLLQLIDHIMDFFTMFMFIPPKLNNRSAGADGEIIVSYPRNTLQTWWGCFCNTVTVTLVTLSSR